MKINTAVGSDIQHGFLMPIMQREFDSYGLAEVNLKQLSHQQMIILNMPK